MVAAVPAKNWSAASILAIIPHEGINSPEDLGSDYVRRSLICHLSSSSSSATARSNETLTRAPREPVPSRLPPIAIEDILASWADSWRLLRLTGKTRCLAEFTSAVRPSDRCDPSNETAKCRSQSPSETQGVWMYPVNRVSDMTLEISIRRQRSVPGWVSGSRENFVIQQLSISY
jgi:hypothetical protein